VAALGDAAAAVAGGADPLSPPVAQLMPSAIPRSRPDVDVICMAEWSLESARGYACRVEH
jgi:hypothetical protein